MEGGKVEGGKVSNEGRWRDAHPIRTCTNSSEPSGSVLCVRLWNTLPSIAASASGLLPSTPPSPFWKCSSLRIPARVAMAMAVSR